MARILAGSIAASLCFLLGACGGAEDPAFTAEALAAGAGPCRCIRESVKDGELVARLVPAGCVAPSGDLPVCPVWEPVPGRNPPHYTP